MIPPTDGDLLAEIVQSMQGVEILQGDLTAAMIVEATHPHCSMRAARERLVELERVGRVRYVGVSGPHRVKVWRPV